MRPFPRLRLPYLLALLVLIALPISASKIEPPVEIVLEADAFAIKPGGRVEIFGVLTPRIDMSLIELRFESEGGAVVDQDSAPRFVSAEAGRPLFFSVSARFVQNGEGAVHVWVDGIDSSETPIWSKRETLYALVRPDRSFVGNGDFKTLEYQAIDHDRAVGKITTEQADAARKSLTRVPYERDDRPMVIREVSDSEKLLNRSVGAPPEGHQPARGGIIRSMAGTITVQGNVQWTDENGNNHPMFGARVNIRDEDLFFDETVVVTITDTNGNYSAVIDNDDGIGAGDRDVYVEIQSRNSLIITRTAGLFGDAYEMQSPVHDETPSGTVITENFTAGATGTNENAWSVFQAATWIAVYTQQVHGSPMPQVDNIYPNGSGGSFYDGAVQIEAADRWDWDTVHHEYGHYVMDRLDIENNPGGPHNIGDCTAQTRPSKSEGLRLAWGEGWPTYFGTSGQQVLNLAALNVPRVGDVSYQDLEDSSVVYSLEAQDANGIGEDNEVAVQRLLWDLFDTNNDSRDTISRSHTSIWTAIDAADPHTPSPAWQALRAGVSNTTDLQMGEIASDHRIGPRLNFPADGATVSPSNANFSWNANVGCSNMTAGNSFTLRFYNAASNASILSIPGLATTSASLTAGQLATLIASSHQVRWAVEGTHTGAPSSGPYLGENNQITVNRPPVANAGPDQPNVECASAGTTAVSLNGLGSTDPDGDPLTYSWSAPGVTFNNPNSATPIGQFPKGTTIATLTVSDSIEQDTDTVSITVVDTTDPVISCPANITVECTGDLGVDADDPQLAPFFGGVSATDVCDSTPTITNNAPAFFPIGITPVTFTATDDAGNSSSCVRTVTVQDTKRPEITVTLSKTVLWPPNHTLETITANVVVTDECDPNPTFVLTSITSNEPDNSLGDGNTTQDIQGAAFGTPDTEFQLRRERSGKGSSRVYTIIYTAKDSSNNTTINVSTVTVPHDK